MRELWQRSFFCNVGLGARIRRRANQPRRPVFRPRLEPLESRTLLSAGDLDPTFGMGGKVTTDFPSYASAIAVQPDGKIVVVGSAAGGALGLARYNPDGSLDAGFGAAGRVITHFPPGIGPRGIVAGDIALQSDGKIVAVGTYGSVTTLNQLVMARYQPDGNLDESFGTSGQVTVDHAGGDKVVIQQDGKIVVGGIEPRPGTCGIRDNVFRFNINGSLDSGFGSGGMVRGFGAPCPFSTAIALQPDGKFVLSGGPGWVVRLTSNGTPDALFGTAGMAPSIDASVVALQPDGRIVVAGVGEPSTYAVARLNTTGAVDATFGAAGKVSTDFGPGMFGRIHAIAIQSNGRVIVAGSVGLTSGSQTRFGLVRYNPNGSLDVTFGVGGRVTTAFDTAQASASGVALQSDGRIIVAGSATSGTASTFAVARYLGDTPSADANQRFLNQLYLDLLGRTIDPGGQATWTAMLNAGVSRMQVTLQIEGSAEYRTRQVLDSYGLLLNRAPEPAGLAAFTGFLRAGGTVEQARAFILGSAEYLTNRSGGTNDGFLAALYRDELGRAIDPSGQATWSGALRAGISRQAVASGVVTSVEADQFLVQGYYRQLLRREADSFGLSTFVGFLQQGGRDEEVIALIAGSDEYFSRLGR